MSNLSFRVRRPEPEPYRESWLETIAAGVLWVIALFGGALLLWAFGP